VAAGRLVDLIEKEATRGPARSGATCSVCRRRSGPDGDREPGMDGASDRTGGEPPDPAGVGAGGGPVRFIGVSWPIIATRIPRRPPSLAAHYSTFLRDFLSDARTGASPIEKELGDIEALSAGR